MAAEIFKLVGRITYEGGNKVTAGLDALGKHVENAEKKLQGFGEKTKAAGQKLTAVGGTMSAAVTLPILGLGAGMIKSASDAQEMQGKFGVVFGKLSGSVEDWAATQADAMGRGKNEMMGYLSESQNLLVGMGMNREGAADLSKQISTLGIDLASFNNLQDKDAIDAITASMLGEHDAAKALGVAINENTLATEMERMGLKGKFDDLDESTKMQVRYGVIVAQSGDAIGDAERTSGSYANQMKKTQGAVKDTAAAMGEHLLPWATKVVTKVGEWITKFGELDTGTQKTILIIAGIAAAIGPLLLVLGTITMGIGTFAKGLGTLGKVFPLIINGAKLLGTALKFLTMNPIGMIITAIGLLVMAGIAIYKNWDVIKPKLLALWEGIKAGLQIAWDAIKAAVMAVFNGIKAYFTFVFNVYKTIIMTVWNVIKTALSAVWNGIKAAAVSVFNAIKNTITTIFNALKTGIVTAWNFIKNAITTTWNAIKSAAVSVFNSIKNTIITIFNTLKTGIVTAWNFIKSAVVGVWNGIKSTAVSVFNSIKNTITGVFNGIKSVASSVWNGIKNTITNVVNGIRSSVSGTFSRIKSAMTGPIQSARDTISGIISKIKGFFTGMSLKIPKISMPSLPHFNLKGKFSLKPPSVPKLSVDWYAKGGVFDGDSIIGVGEKGPEAVVPLTGPRMKPFAEAVGQEIPGGANGGIVQHYNFYQPINRPTEVMRKNREETRRLAAEMGMRT